MRGNADQTKPYHTKSTQHPFENALSVLSEDIDLELRGIPLAPWADFFLNPRRLRGSDFLMRWSQGQWSEDRLMKAINATNGYYALPYGPSGVAPDHDVREFELYFERLEAVGLGDLKRPDLLIFRKSDESSVQAIIGQIGGVQELPFLSETHLRLSDYYLSPYLRLSAKIVSGFLRRCQITAQH